MGLCTRPAQAQGQEEMITSRPSAARQQTPGERLCFNPTPLARRGCTWSSGLNVRYEKMGKNLRGRYICYRGVCRLRNSGVWWVLRFPNVGLFTSSSVSEKTRKADFTDGHKSGQGPSRRPDIHRGFHERGRHRKHELVLLAFVTLEIRHGFIWRRRKIPGSL